MTSQHQPEEIAKKTALPADISRALAAVRRRHLLITAGELLALFAILVLSLLTAQVLLDYFLDLSRIVRAILLGIILVVILSVIGPRLVRMIKKRWSEESAALAIQRQWPELGSRVISSLQFSQAKGTGINKELYQTLANHTAERIKPLPLKEITPAKRFGKRLLALIALVAVIGTGGYYTWSTTQILLARLMLKQVPFPTDTMVFPITEDVVVPSGSSVELAARIEGVIHRQGQLEIIPENGSRRQITVNLDDKSEDNRFSYMMENVQQGFTYRFRIGDGTGFTHKATVVPAPVLHDGTFTFTYPEYTGKEPVSFPVGPVTLFKGGTLKLDAKATQQLDAATIVFHGPNSEKSFELEVNSRNSENFSGEFPIPDEEITGISLRMKNTYGVVSINPTVYPVTIERDETPTIVITQPRSMEESLVAGVTLPVRAEIKDDYGVVRVFLVYEFTTEDVDFAQTYRRTLSPKDGVIELDLNAAPGEPAWRVGSTITWWIEALDNRRPGPPGVGSSERRTISMVTLTQKRQELLGKLDEASGRIEQIAERQRISREQLGEILREDDSETENSPAP